MKATHTCYKHPNHLRVETGQAYPAWNAVQGDYFEDALCMAPGASDYRKLNKPGEPCYVRETGGQCRFHG